MSGAESKQWRAVTMKRSPLLRVNAADEDAAVILLTKELNRPNRQAALAAWEKGGMLVEEVESDSPELTEAKAMVNKVMGDKVPKVSVGSAPAPRTEAKAEGAEEPSSIKSSPIEDEAELEIVDLTEDELDVFLNGVVFTAKDAFHTLIDNNLTRDNVQKTRNTLVSAIEGTLPANFKKGDKVTVALKSWNGFICIVEKIEGDKAVVSIKHSRAGKKSYNTKTQNLRRYTE